MPPTPPRREAIHHHLDRRRQESYYRNAKGRVTTNSPWRLLDYWSWTREPHPADYQFL